MVTIGYLHYRKRPVKSNKAYAFASVAKAEGAELLYFSPGAVDFQNRKINGYKYIKGRWRKITSEFPDVIYNASGLSTARQEEIVDKLMAEIPFTSHAIGSKMTVFNHLVKYGEFMDYLIPTENVSSSEHFFELIERYGKIVIKPSIGSQGIDIYFIEKAGEGYEILSCDEKWSLNHEETTGFIVGKINEEVYIAQPYISSLTKHGHPYDIRIHTQKNIRREWTAVKIYPRVSVTGSIVCNIHGGGYTAAPEAFFKREFGDDWIELMSQIEEFGVNLSAHMDMIQKDLYNEELDELGIDIGVDENRKICIYEINWRPGSPPTMNPDFSAVKNLIHYSMLLASGEGER